MTNIRRLNFTPNDHKTQINTRMKKILFVLSMLCCVLAVQAQKKEGFKNGTHDYTYADGRVYRGQWLEMQPSGQGTMTWPDGKKYVGQWKMGNPNGQGTFTQPHGGSAIGEWKNGGAWNAVCKNFRFDNEHEYTGNYTSGKIEGQGTLFFYSGKFKGNKYVGKLRNNKFNGQGTYTWPDGKKYVGQWVDDRMNGQGTMTYADGNEYVGQWVSGQRGGQGTMTYADGSKYVGEWKNGKRDGQGTFTFGPNQPWIKQTGVFRNGIFVSGTFERTNGTLVGEWNEDGSAKFVREVK